MSTGSNDNLSCATLKYSLSLSIPINFLLVLLDATPVVPDPIQGSRIVSPSFEYVLIKYSYNAIGFCVGCNLPSPSAVLKYNTLRGYLFPSVSFTWTALVCFPYASVSLTALPLS